MIIRTRFHGRGGQGAKTASRILGSAAFGDGYNVQDFPLYGAERRGAPVTAFTRFSDQEITERGFIFGPDVVGLMDESLLDDPLANPLAGLRKGGVAVVNTTRKVSDLKSDRRDITILTLDLTGLALNALGKPILSAAVAAAVARVVSVTEGSLAAAVAEELGYVGLSQDTIEKNVELARKVYSSLEPIELKTEELESSERLVPIAFVLQGSGNEDILAAGNSPLRGTGDWRTFRPVIDYAKCTDCLICYAYCPESALSLGADGRLHIDYDNCKGCMICMTECPLKAVAQQMEVSTA
ncbi:MAG TPA: 2-oxoacid:acceptor oxidoreductase family protein [Nitrososphaerales archaeon]|nr:2-oxoacid:acceptor oxidoreductase family protein [Nitrososphaerales archaeon]